MRAQLVLEDGSNFEGSSSGVTGERIGEVVVHTAVVGYQEIMTDPANAGKIIVFTYPLIGNYGVAKKFYASKKCWLRGVAINEKSRIYSNWQAEEDFETFLKKEKVVGISDVDTRTLALRIRDKGEMFGIISTKKLPKAALLKKLRTAKKDSPPNYIKDISVKKVTRLKGNATGPTIAVLDLGISNDYLRQFVALGCTVVLVPHNKTAETILKLKPDGLVISSGPEEDGAISGVVEVVKGLLGRLPLFGISLGHEIIGRAIGAKVSKMKVGHHGINYPVRSTSSYKGDITVQNHSFVISDIPRKASGDIAITLRNVNDNSIEEMEGGALLRFISTQYCPLSPGCGEVHGALRRFVQMVRKEKE